MSFLKKLFGLGGEPAAPKAEAPEEHNGFLIHAMPFKDQGQWQVCGLITREVDGVVKEAKFIRVDRFSDRQTAIELTVMKGRQIINEQGLGVFG